MTKERGGRYKLSLARAKAVSSLSFSLFSCAQLYVHARALGGKISFQKFFMKALKGAREKERERERERESGASFLLSLKAIFVFFSRDSDSIAFILHPSC